MLNRYIISVLLIIILVIVLSCDTKDDLISDISLYRSGIVTVDTLNLPSGTVLFKGNLVQIITEKSTEEGIFIKIKNDSALVYYRHIATLCWLKNDMEVKTIDTNETYNINKTDWLIFDSIENANMIVLHKGKKIKIPEEDISFDNQRFFYMITQ